MKNGKGKIMLLLIVLSIGICKVNALSIRNGNFIVSNYDTNENGTFFHNNINFGNNVDRSFTITGGNTVKDYDYISFGITVQYSYSTQYNETTMTEEYNQDTASQIEYVCGSYVQRTQTYADGTVSTYYVCNSWSQADGWVQEGTTGGTIYNIPDITFAVYAVYDNGSYSACEVENSEYGTALATCIVSDTANTINTIRIRNIGSNYYNNISGRYGITAYHTAWKDPNKTASENIITNNNQNAQDIQDGINNSDYTGTTEQPDATDFNSYEQKEQTLENMASAEMTAVNVGLNANASNWIWNIINRILNTNPIIMAFYITILSIGVIKLIMRR